MPLTKLQFRPGFNREVTDYTNEGGWYDGDKVRFRFGFPEKIGGWAKYTSSSVLGISRALLPWYDLAGEGRIGVGTNLKYYVEYGGAFFDITPIRATTSAGAVTFSASNGSSVITVTHTAHNALNGDFVTFSGADSLGGVITADVLNQEYQITYVDTNTYTIVARAYVYAETTISDITVDGELSFTPLEANGSDTGNGGTSVVGTYQINVAQNNTALGAGWGAGGWGRDGWGDAATNVGTASYLKAWSHDTFGEDLLLNRRGGPIYVWDTSVGTGTRATDMSAVGGATEVPVVANRVLISDRDRHVIALGANPEGTSTAADLDPMLIRFSDQENYTNWATTDLTTGGSLRLDIGSEIVTGVVTRQQTLVFTDLALYAMQYLGPPFTFGVTLISRGIGILSPEAAVAVDDAVYFMGDHAFYRYDGAVTEIPCPVLRYVFDDMDSEATYKVVCGGNVEFGEVWWFYPSSSGECDRYVVYNYKENIWYTGSLSRTAWVDAANGNKPIAVSPSDGHIYTHESGFNDGSTDPSSAISANISSSPMDLADGHSFVFVDRMMPDVDFGASTTGSPSVTITTTAENSPAGYASTTYANVVEPDTYISHLRLRGRHFSVSVASSQTNMEWRLGSLRYDTRKDGRQ